MTVFKNFSDEQVKEQLFSNFRFLTSDELPFSKGSNKNEDKTDAEWFHELSFMHMFIFCQAFHEATARNLMNAFEKAACQELFDML